MATIARLDVLLGLKDNTFTKGLDSSRNKLNSWGESLRSIGTKLTAGVTVPLVAAGIGLVKWGADLENTMATTEKVFGSATDQVRGFANTSAKSFGIAKQDALDYQIYFAGMLDQIAEGPKELANMSTELTKLTADFGAFFNLTNEEAFTVIQSALAGETESIRRYGVDVSAAAVETKALELGLAATTAELTEQDKALARYHLIMEQTTHMQGQFADESDSITGKLKTLQARFQDLGTTVSGHLLPYADRLLGVGERLMGWLESLSPATQRWALAIAAVAAAIGPLLIGIGFLLPAMGTGLAIIAALFSPIGLLVAGIVALGAGVVIAARSFAPLTNAVKSIFNTVKNAVRAFKDMWDSLSGVTEAVERSQGFYASWSRTIEVVSTSVNTLSRFLLSLSAALKSINGDNTPAWLVAVALGLDELAGRVQFAVNVFNNLRSVGLDPVQAALQTLATVFPVLQDLVTALRGVVLNLVDAFNQLRAGNISGMFEALGEAALRAWDAVREGLSLLGQVAQAFGSWVLDVGVPTVTGWIVDVAGDVWNGLVALAGWTWDRIADLGTITVQIGGWIVNTAQDLWEAIKRKIYGWLGGGGSDTAGQIASIVAQTQGVPIGQLAVMIEDWLINAAVDLWDRIRSWGMGETGGVLSLPSIAVSVGEWVQGVMPPIGEAIERFISYSWGYLVELGKVALSILTFDPSYNGTPIDILIEDMLGSVVVTLSGVLVEITGFKWNVPNIAAMVNAGLIAIAAGIVIASVPISVPILLTLGAITLAVLFATAIAQWIADWAARNPIDAVKVLVNIGLALGNIDWPDPPSIDSLKETALSLIGLPKDGFIRVGIGVIFEFFDGGSEQKGSGASIEDAAGDTAITGFKAAQKAGDPKLYGGGSAEQLMGNNWGGGLAALGRQIADGLDNIKNNVIQPKVGEWGTTFQTGVAPLSTIAAAAFNAIPAVATPAMVATGSVVGTQTSFMNTTASTNWAAMLGSAVLNFTNTRLTGTSNTSLLGSTVASTLSTMATNAGSSFGTMASRGISETTRMRIGTIAESAMAAGGIASELISGGARAVSGFGGQIGRLAGVVTSAGGSAIGAASSLGTNVGSALAGALDAMYGPVSAAASRLAGAAAEAMALALQVSSPSRWAIWLIEMLGKGLLIGFDRIARPVIGSAGGVGDAITNALNPSATLPDIDLPGRSAHNNGERPFVQIITLEPGKWKEFLQKAENGDTFARGFSGELGMQMGRS